MKRLARLTCKVIQINMPFLLVFLSLNQVKAQQNIDSLEYGIDNIGAFGQATKIAIPPAPVVSNFPFTVNTSSVNNGFHTLLVRTHSSTVALPDTGHWSQTNYTWFYKQNTLQPTAGNITKLEYFIDTDPGEGNAIPITVTPAVQVSGISFTPNIGSLTVGFHILYIRSLDANGKWSITNYQYFYKQNNTPASVSNITKLEYFVDIDPGEGNATPITVTPAVQVSGISFTPNIGALGIGFHTIFIRSLDANGKWSITNYQYFYKQNTTPAAVSTITRLEYFIDSDPGAGNGQSIVMSPATNISGLSFNADITALGAGFHTIFTRSLDANGKWSITNYNYFYKSGQQGPGANIVKIEYFIDTDPGYTNAVNIPVTPAPDIANKAFSANITGLPIGLHYFYIRSLDSRGIWSVNAYDTFRIQSAVPLKLVSFFATPQGSAVKLYWQTSFEENLLRFEPEFSTDGTLFYKIGEVVPANSPLGSNYTFNHLHPLAGKNFYRLKIIEKDNSYHYSETRLVIFNGEESVVSLYPNPADKYFIVKTSLTDYTINIIAADGKLVRKVAGMNADNRMDVTDLPTALYNIRITNQTKTMNIPLIVKH